MGHVVGWFLVGITTLTHPAASAAQECERADALVVARRLEEARAAYTIALASDSTWECALQGVNRLASAYVQLGETFLRVEQRDSARNSFLRAMTQSPRSPAATNAEAYLRTMRVEDERIERQSSGDPFEIARALSELGMLSAARDSLGHAVAREPTRPIPTDLRYLSGGPLPLWRAIGRWVEAWVRFSPELLALLLLLAYLAVAARRKPHLAIEDFHSESVKDASQIGGGFTGMLGTALVRLVEGERDQSIELVQAEVAPTEISANVQNLVPGGGAWIDGVLKVIRLVDPVRALVLEGHLHQDSIRGVGVTMQLRRGNRVIAGITLWLSQVWTDQQPSAAKDFAALAEAAATWLIFHLPDRKGAPLRMLGTSDWLAYAHFQASLRRRSAPPPKPVDLLQSALSRDPNFAAAVANLAIQYLTQSFPEVDARAKALLERVREVGGTHAENNPTPFVALIYLVQIAQSQGDRKAAAAYAQSLVSEIDRVEQSKLASDAFKSYVARMRPTGEIMQAIYSAGASAEIVKLDETYSDSGSWHNQYSLACAWSIVAESITDAHERLTAEGKSLDRLESAFALHEGARRWAPKDQALEWVRDKASQGTRNRFKELAKPSAPKAPSAPPPPPLSLLLSIPQAYAEKLKDLGIGDWEDLLLRTQLAAQRQQLATAVDVPLDTVECWAHLADLQRIVGLRAREVNLLQLCGISTLKALAATSNDVQLASALTAIASTQGAAPPPLEQVRTWILDAKGLQPKIA